MVKVLVLEDEAHFADDLKDKVEKLGHTVMGPASDCSSALELIWRERPDLAILDTVLGSETCEVVLQECEQQGIPVIISLNDDAAAAPAFATDYYSVSKPYMQTALSAAFDGHWQDAGLR